MTNDTLAHVPVEVEIPTGPGERLLVRTWTARERPPARDRGATTHRPGRLVGSQALRPGLAAFRGPGVRSRSPVYDRHHRGGAT